MPNHNRAPRGFALFAGATLALSACTSNPSSEAVQHMPKTFPQDAAHSAGCGGTISQLGSVHHTQNGEEYQITAIDDGDCAQLYTNKALGHKLVGSVSVGTMLLDPCKTDSNIDLEYPGIFVTTLSRSGDAFLGSVVATGEVASVVGSC